MVEKAFSLASLSRSEIEAVIEVTFLAAYCDGQAPEAERIGFRAQILAQTEGQLDRALVESILTKLDGSFKPGSGEARLAALEARIPDERARRAALELAGCVVLADGRIDIDEVEFLQRAADALGLDPSIAMKCLPREKF